MSDVEIVRGARPQTIEEYDTMSKVYRFTIYDIRNDESVLSRRWATRQAIEWAHGHALKGFQRRVTR
jgi:hypothetical protein